MYIKYRRGSWYKSKEYTTKLQSPQRGKQQNNIADCLKL